MTQVMGRREPDESASEAGPSGFQGSLDFIPFELEDDDKSTMQRRGSPASGETKVKGGKAAGQKRKAAADDADDDETKGKRRTSYKTPSMRKRERRQLISTTPWCDLVDFDRCSNPTEMLHDELIAFADWMSPTPKEHEVRQMVIQLIRRAISKEWPDARVEAFGSQNTQLYMPHGDIDLVVVSDAMEEQRREHVLRKMAALLRRHNLATDVQVIAKAKVPIVKFVCTHGRLKVDISVNQTNGIHASHLVNDWLQRCPSLRPLIMATKLFLSSRGLSEVFSGGLGSFSVICLVISHIQMHPKVQRGELDPALNLGILFLDFLELYGKNFGYDNVGITIRSRGSYFTKVSRGWRDDRRPFMLSIEDPLDPTNDISKGSFGIIQVRSALGGAFDILTATLCQRANEQKRPSRSRDEDDEARRALVDGAGRSDGKDPRSVLGAIFGVNREMTKYKRELEQLWQSGTLQHKLGRSPPGRSPEPISTTTTNTPPNESVERMSHTMGDASRTSRGSASDPVIVYDDSDRGNDQSRDEGYDNSSVIVDEEEFAESQGFQFGQGETEESDSRYAAGPSNAKKNEQNGVRSHERRGRSRLDAFADRAPRQFVDDDDDDEESSSEISSAPELIREAGVSAPARSAEDEARRERKNAFWASKGNSTAAHIRADDEEASDEGDKDGEDGVMLSIYD